MDEVEEVNELEVVNELEEVNELDDMSLHYMNLKKNVSVHDLDVHQLSHDGIDHVACLVAYQPILDEAALHDLGVDVVQVHLDDFGVYLNDVYRHLDHVHYHPDAVGLERLPQIYYPRRPALRCPLFVA